MKYKVKKIDGYFVIHGKVFWIWWMLINEWFSNEEEANKRIDKLKGL